MVICVVQDSAEGNRDYNPELYDEYFNLGRIAAENREDPFDADPSGFSYEYSASAFRDGYYNRLQGPIRQ